MAEGPLEDALVAVDQPGKALPLEPAGQGSEDPAVGNHGGQGGDDQQDQGQGVGRGQPGGRQDGQGDQPPASAPREPWRAFPFQAQPAAAQHRDDHKGDEQGARQGHDQGRGQVLHELADGAGPEQQRTEGGQGRQCRGDDGQGHLPDRLARRRCPLPALLDVAVGVLDDDDGVVDQHAEGEDQREQDHHVHGHPEQPEEEKGEQHRRRDGDSHEHRGAHPEEEQEHGDDQQQAGEDVVLQAVDHHADVAGHVRGRLHHRRRREVRLHRGDRRVHGVGGLDDVLPRPLDHVEGHHGQAVEAGVALALGEPEIHLGDVAHVHRAAPRGVHDEVADRQGVVDLAVDADQELPLADVDRAPGDVDVLVAHRLDHVLQSQAVVEQPRQGDVDLDLALAASAQVDAQNRRDLLEAVLKLFAHLLEADQPVLPGQVDLQDRHFLEVELEDAGLLGVGG